MRWDDPGGAGVDPWNQKTPDGRDVVIRKNSRPESIAYEIEQSLRRLRTDYVDLYQIHWPDTSTPFEDSMAAMENLRKAGKIRAIGVSNYNVEQMKRAMKAGPLASLQPPYSVLRRAIEAEILPFCRENHIGVIVYSPLERGLLTGKVTPDRKFPPGDHRNEHKLFTVENRRKVLAALESIRPIADRYKATFAQLMINYTMQVPGITAALVGARNADQANSNAYALTFALTADECRQIRTAFDPLVV
jgi:aryl-alcohol dehydrogenase-like predicted oxidoreductase